MDWIFFIILMVVMIIVVNRYEDRQAEEIEKAYERGYSEGQRQAHFDSVGY
jgi:predicted Ser/Thr protein kinase